MDLPRSKRNREAIFTRNRASLARQCFSVQEQCRKAKGRGFSLIEIMIVISIVAIVITAGVPTVFRAMQKDELARAANDIVEGCSNARARAILQGTPAEFVIHAEDGSLSVQTAPERRSREPDKDRSNPLPSPSSEAVGTPLPAAFSSHLGADIAIRLLDVNFKDHMELPEARVRFFPNGTSDEFTIVIDAKNAQRKISLDVVTGLADVEVLR